VGASIEWNPNFKPFPVREAAGFVVWVFGFRVSGGTSVGASIEWSPSFKPLPVRRQLRGPWIRVSDFQFQVSGFGEYISWREHGVEPKFQALAREEAVPRLDALFERVGQQLRTCHLHECLVFRVKG